MTNFGLLVRWARKPASWEADGIEVVTNPLALAEIPTLPVFAAEEAPCDDFVGDRPQFFVATWLGRRFLVNTEGYRYARYVAAVPADFQFSAHGSVWLVEPYNAGARAYLAAHVGPDAQWLGRALAVAPQYVEALADGLREDGWSVQFAF